MAKYLLGTDNGCTVSKAALFDTAGKEIAVASRKTGESSPQPGWFERDIDEMWTATAEAVREVIDTAGVDPGEIACVTPTGHGNGIYMVDKAGRPVRPAIISTDSRAREYIDKWLADGVDDAVLEKTTQKLWPAQPNALLSWLRDNEPETIKNAAWVLMCKDYVRFKLTGNFHAELTDFSGTSLINVPGACHDESVLTAFGIADMAHLLPPLVRPEEICGEVTPAAAAETGLKTGTPVAGGMFDIDACGLATGLVNDTQLCMISGTWGNNQYIATEPVVSKDVFMTSCYAIPGYYLMLEGSATSGSNLEWFVSRFFAADGKLAAAQGRGVYDVCNELVASTNPEDADIIFLPFLYGSNAGADAKSCLIGMSGWHGRAHVLRAIYEGVVFAHKTHVQRLLKFRRMPRKVRFTGGGSRSREWVQIFADVFQAPLEIPEGTELGALGACICGAVAAGIHDSYQAAVEAMVTFTRTQEPDPGKKDLYEAKFARYNKALAALDPAWKELA